MIIPTTLGIMQGCSLALYLFNPYLLMSGVRYTNLRCADDTVVVTETAEDLQMVVQKVEEQCKKYKLEINEDNTKSLKSGRERRERYLLLSTGVIEEVNDFKYPGEDVRDGAAGKKTLKEQIAVEQGDFGRLSKK